MHVRTTASDRAADRPARKGGRHRRPPVRGHRPKLYLGVAVAGAVLVNVVLGTQPDAEAEATADPVSVAARLGLTAQSAGADATPDLAPLEDLAASRSARESAQAAARSEQAAADRSAAEQQQAEAEAAASAAAESSAAASSSAAAAASAEVEAAAAPEPAEATGQQVEEAPAAPVAAASSAVARITNSAGKVEPQVQVAADAVVANVPGAAGITLGGTRPSATDPGGHPSGLALDYMVLSDQALGNAIIAYHVAHWDELGVDYLIYRQRMLSSPDGAWEPMADRGSPTANHYDHVHVNYRG